MALGDDHLFLIYRIFVTDVIELIGQVDPGNPAQVIVFEGRFRTESVLFARYGAVIWRNHPFGRGIARFRRFIRYAIRIINSRGILAARWRRVDRDIVRVWIIGVIILKTLNSGVAYSTMTL